MVLHIPTKPPSRAYLFHECLGSERVFLDEEIDHCHEAADAFGDAYQKALVSLGCWQQESCPIPNAVEFWARLSADTSPLGRLVYVHLFRSQTFHSAEQKSSNVSEVFSFIKSENKNSVRLFSAEIFSEQEWKTLQKTATEHGMRMAQFGEFVLIGRDLAFSVLADMFFDAAKIQDPVYKARYIRHLRYLVQHRMRLAYRFTSHVVAARTAHQIEFSIPSEMTPDTLVHEVVHERDSKFSVLSENRLSGAKKKRPSGLPPLFNFTNYRILDELNAWRLGSGYTTPAREAADALFIVNENYKFGDNLTDLQSTLEAYGLGGLSFSALYRKAFLNPQAFPARKEPIVLENQDFSNLQPFVLLELALQARSKTFKILARYMILLEDREEEFRKRASEVDEVLSKNYFNKSLASKNLPILKWILRNFSPTTLPRFYKRAVSVLFESRNSEAFTALRFIFSENSEWSVPVIQLAFDPQLHLLMHPLALQDACLYVQNAAEGLKNHSLVQKWISDVWILLAHENFKVRRAARYALVGLSKQSPLVQKKIEGALHQPSGSLYRQGAIEVMASVPVGTFVDAERILILDSGFKPTKQEKPYLDLWRGHTIRPNASNCEWLAGFKK